MQAALESAFRELAFGPELSADGLGAFIERHGFEPDDAEALVAEWQRLGVYRRLLRHNLFEAIEVAIPRVIARLGSVFNEYFDRFLAERGPRTHYLRDVTRELLDFCEPLWKADARVPPYMLDLARHENAQIELGAMQTRPLGGEPAELSLEQPVLFIEAVRLMRYGYAVHRLSDSVSDRTEPSAEPTAILVYRNPEHEVRYLELTPLASRILERLLTGEPLGAAITAACAVDGTPLDASVIDGSARLLADLAERGALLGAA